MVRAPATMSTARSPLQESAKDRSSSRAASNGTTSITASSAAPLGVLLGREVRCRDAPVVASSLATIAGSGARSRSSGLRRFCSPTAQSQSRAELMNPFEGDQSLDLGGTAHRARVSSHEHGGVRIEADVAERRLRVTQLALAPVIAVLRERLAG